MDTRFLARHKLVIIYGSSLALLLFLLKWLEWRFIILDHALEIYSGAIAVVFTGLGIWLAIKLAKPKVKTVVVEKEVYIKEPVIADGKTAVAGMTGVDALSPRE